MKPIQFLWVFLIFLASTDSFAESKEQYTLFNPTPRDRMRELSTDRPDKTESAYTVDAGHFQHETDIISYTFDREGGVTNESYLLGVPNLKVGLTNSTDLQIIPETYVYQRSRTPRSKSSGFGDTVVRLKHNLFGNDEGEMALSVMPYIKLPTARGELGNGKVEGGLIVPWGLDFTESIGIGTTTTFDNVRDSDNEGNHFEFSQSGTLGADLTDKIGAYIELWTSLSARERGPLVTFDAGFTYALCEDTQLDIGLNTGLTDQTDDLNPFLGISQRF
jgi:hypothetical protein